MKKCLVSIRKNGKDVANLFDQDGDTNKVKIKQTKMTDIYFIPMFSFTEKKTDLIEKSAVNAFIMINHAVTK